MVAIKALSLLAVVSAVVAAPLEKRTSGTATYFYQNGNAGSCGTVHSDSSYVVAISGGGHCGSTVHIKNTSNGKSITAKVADTCPSCSYSHIDLSVGAFEALGSKSQGVLPIEWSMS